VCGESGGSAETLRGIKKEFYNGAILFCVVFSFATIISSTIQLLVGTENDSNFHIIIRGLVTLIGITAFWMSWKANFRIKIFDVLIPYCVSLVMVLAAVFFSGFFVELHPNAYRDIFLNYTVACVIIITIVRLTLSRRSRKNQRGNLQDKDNEQRNS
jgi:hypothetical protein